jgi:hypothetical protein
MLNFVITEVLVCRDGARKPCLVVVIENRTRMYGTTLLEGRLEENT